jgi:hypothetical protein
MSTLMIDVQAVRAQNLSITQDSLSVDLMDGRAIVGPLGWYPRLLHATATERNNWRFSGHGQGIHWPLIDEDISVENLLSGRASGESQTSLKRWLESREK